MLKVVHRGSFHATGSGSATAIIGAAAGLIRCTNLSLFSDAVGTLKFYLANAVTTSGAALAAGTGLSINTDSEGKVAGAVLTTNDYVIIADSSGTGYQLRSISNVADVSDDKVTLTLGASATCASGDEVFVVRAADIISRATTDDEATTDAKDQFNGYFKMPVAVVVTATGTDEVSGTYDVER